MVVMVVRHHVDAKTLGKRFAEIVRARDLPVDGIWVRDTEEGPKLWILIEPMELKDELPVHRATIDLETEFDSEEIHFDVVNPTWFPGQLVQQMIPGNTEQIELAG
jgi:hypothetical protein